ncbi:F0F1 ATP synthase subunit A [Candidatus Chlorohelix sp.]|uniref:F0F1 ATP synthase subunit A n=1 Tax=Candidatus Chlorohelix sp. TaxID=3139201 RepID=UPI0030205BAA
MEEFKLVVSLKPEPIMCIGGKMDAPAVCSKDTFFIVTNSTIATVLFMLITFFLLWSGARKAKLIPGRWQSVVEILVESLHNMVVESTSKRVAKVIFPLVATYFTWILFANWLSLIPGVGSIGFVRDVTEDGKVLKEMVPLLRGPNADLNMTFAMALLAVIIVQIAAIVSHGVKGWLKEFIPEPHWMDPLLTPLEIIGQFTRILSLAFRLFGNVFAGEVLLAVMLKIAAPSLIVFLGLEIFVGFIQALVFAILTLTYLSLVTAGGHEESHHDKEHEEHAKAA